MGYLEYLLLSFFIALKTLQYKSNTMIKREENTIPELLYGLIK